MQRSLFLIKEKWMRGCLPSLNVLSMGRRRQNTDQPSTNNAANSEHGVLRPKPTHNVLSKYLKKPERRSGATAADMPQKTFNKKVTDNPIPHTQTPTLSPSRLETLPTETLQEIFQHMNAKTLATVSQASRRLHYAAAQPLEREWEREEKQLTQNVYWILDLIPRVETSEDFISVLKRIKLLPARHQSEPVAELGGQMCNLLLLEHRLEAGAAWLPVAEQVPAPRPGLLDAVVNAIRRDPEWLENDWPARNRASIDLGE
ncbi:F-box protein [Mycetohabitans sp. B46]|uniref:F-box protein n=1 Tax=Mycetohabitans sp. B46 TaxID=2772536 RepID=UPI00307E1CE9